MRHTTNNLKQGYTTMSDDLQIRLATIPPFTHGGHLSPADGFCAMEAVSFLANEPWSDSPECACPVIGAFLRSWNDQLQYNRRDELLRPLTLRIIGTKSTASVEAKRATMAADWLIRIHTPFWLRLVGLNTQADNLSNISEITDFAQCPSLTPLLETILTDANDIQAAVQHTAMGVVWATPWDDTLNIARNATRNAIQDAAWDAAWAAGRNAACAAVQDVAQNDPGWDAAWAAGRDASWAATQAIAWGAAWAAAWAAAQGDTQGTIRSAARNAAHSAACAALAEAVTILQSSAVDLVVRMIEVKP